MKRLSTTATTTPPTELDLFLADGMAQAVETLGVTFYLLGKPIKGVPAPLEADAELVMGGTHIKQGWSIMVPLPASKDAFPVGAVLKDSRGRSFKVLRHREYRMALNIIVTDLNQ